MCGIFGIIIKPTTHYPGRNIAASLRTLALLSESRGKDSSGISFHNEQEKSLDVIKGDIPVSDLLRSPEYKEHLDSAVNSYEEGSGFSAFGHARLVTNGSQLQEVNNQPVIKEGILTIHNGIIVNVEELWKQHPEISREYLIDTEIIPALIRNRLNSEKKLVEATTESLRFLEGTYSIAATFAERDQFILATNNGSFYYYTDQKTFFVFASERHMLLELVVSSTFRPFTMQGLEIHQLNSMQGMVIDLSRITLSPFGIMEDTGKEEFSVRTKPLEVRKYLLDNPHAKEEVVIDPALFINRGTEDPLFRMLEYNIDAIKRLKRCTRCLLPETFPFIEYDENGVCNLCRNYVPKNRPANLDALRPLLEKHRSLDNKIDCIVPFSGGRDSTYALHILKNELGMHPIAYTYDWGMVTDLARRNIARVCGKNGIENIIVAADIHNKRRNIRLNIEAWLKRPVLGLVPLFMAGDKSFHYYLIQLQKQIGITLNIWGENYLENTDFKTGFSGVQPNFNKEKLYSMNKSAQKTLLLFLVKNLAQNPSYINVSLFDNLKSLASRQYYKKTDYYNFYDFTRWDEEKIIRTIRDEYDWELAVDTKSTWRIGDGTASFYNYIYYTVAGFTEFDTFRSNQIREGLIEREKAMELVNTENFPRYETLRWYLQIIGIDFEKVIRRINAIPKLYQK